MARQNSITTRQYYLQSDLSEVWNRIAGQRIEKYFNQKLDYPPALCVAAVSLENEGADTALGPPIIMVPIMPAPPGQTMQCGLSK